MAATPITPRVISDPPFANPGVVNSAAPPATTNAPPAVPVAGPKIPRNPVKAANVKIGPDYWAQKMAQMNPTGATQLNYNVNKMPAGWWNGAGNTAENGQVTQFNGAIPVNQLTDQDKAFLAAAGRTLGGGFDPRNIASGSANDVSTALGVDTMRGIQSAQNDAANFSQNVSPAVLKAMQDMVSQNPEMQARYSAFLGQSNGKGGTGTGAAGDAIQARSSDRPATPQVSSNDPNNYTTFGGTGPAPGYVPPGSVPPAAGGNGGLLPPRDGGAGGVTPDAARGGTTTTTNTGIVNSATGGTMAPLPPPPSTTSESVNPVMGEVTAPQTVQGQLGDILKTGNPLLEAAKARAMQTANARGLQNSSMAAQGGEEAMLAAAMPIATADAATYSKQALTNQTITNEFLSMDKGKAVDLEKAYAAFQQNNYRFDKDDVLKKYIEDAGNSTQLKVAAIQAEAQKASLDQRLQELGIQNSAEMERLLAAQDFTTKQNLLQLKTNNATNYYNYLSQLTNADLTPEDKQNKIDILNQQYAGMQMPDGWIAPIFAGSASAPKTTNGGTAPTTTTDNGTNTGNGGN